MTENGETKKLMTDLKGYLEFQGRMGNGKIRTERKDAPPEREPAPGPSKTNKKTPVISIPFEGNLFENGGANSLEEIRTEMGECERCKLHAGRKTIVFGEGNPKAKVVFVGEGPGKDEDEQGRPFVGRAGKLLNKVIEAMGMKREEVYICNVVKCRPPENRNPETDEVASCEPFLMKQISCVSPRVIVCLGLVAAKAVLKLQGSPSLGSLRGVFHRYGKTKLMVTYHPAALLRNPGFKRPMWEDMKTVMAELKKT
ncbi:MAG: uracil-DNA glycosylase [Candidatus Mycalebacterium zealandia]|nr:MAG: uracil-DNA glycosylase [Candidatus Mycalebacterium zealandia]